jgi:hypothetical protein
VVRELFHRVPWITNIKTLHFSDPVQHASYRFIIRLYIFPVRATDPERLQQRNEKIRELYLDGESISALADMFDLSPQRIYQIVKRRNH